MTDFAIRVENLSKKYRIGQRERYLALRDTLATAFSAPFRAVATAVRRPLTAASSPDGGPRSAASGPEARSGQPSLVGSGEARSGRPLAVGGRDNFIWALKDVLFEVKPGEVVGVIGRNGAGKTTLLKILSRITKPSVGYADICGRVGSLLEVGTGFHPELTGRENIYLNGAILGMKEVEIERKFDEIVAFAEIEKFMDTPVKRYSSGMYVRLAFAVAAHLEPEILLVDEVLAVGDVEFQKKCLGKMESVGYEGRTVLFVSHNMGAIRRLCSRALLLNEGELLRHGPVSEVIEEYLKLGTERAGERVWHNLQDAPGDEVVRLTAVRLRCETGEPRTIFDVREPVLIEMEYVVLKERYPLCTTFYLYNDTGTLVLATFDNLDSPWRETWRPRGLYKSVCRIPGDFLNAGQISVRAAIATDTRCLHVEVLDAVVFRVDDSMDSDGVRGNIKSSWPAAAIRPRLHWTVERKPWGGEVG